MSNIKIARFCKMTLVLMLVIALASGGASVFSTDGVYAESNKIKDNTGNVTIASNSNKTDSNAARVIWRYYDPDDINKSLGNKQIGTFTDWPTDACTNINFSASKSFNPDGVTIKANNYPEKLTVIGEQPYFFVYKDLESQSGECEDVTKDATYDFETGMVVLPKQYSNDDISVIFYSPITEISDIDVNYTVNRTKDNIRHTAQDNRTFFSSQTVMTFNVNEKMGSEDTITAYQNGYALDESDIGVSEKTGTIMINAAPLGGPVLIHINDKSTVEAKDNDIDVDVVRNIDEGDRVSEKKYQKELSKNIEIIDYLKDEIGNNINVDGTNIASENLEEQNAVSHENDNSIFKKIVDTVKSLFVSEVNAQELSNDIMKLSASRRAELVKKHDMKRSVKTEGEYNVGDEYMIDGSGKGDDDGGAKVYLVGKETATDKKYGSATGLSAKYPSRTFGFAVRIFASEIEAINNTQSNFGYKGTLGKDKTINGSVKRIGTKDGSGPRYKRYVWGTCAAGHAGNKVSGQPVWGTKTKGSLLIVEHDKDSGLSSIHGLIKDIGNTEDSSKMGENDYFQNVAFTLIRTLDNVGELGYLDVQKVSENPVETEKNEYYSLQGAEFTIYDDKDCESEDKVDTIVTNSNGYAKSNEIEAKTYWVKETKAPKGFKLDTKTYTVEVEPDKTASIYNTTVSGKKVFEDKAQKGKFKLKKVSKCPEMTNDNKLYSDFSGATFEYYRDKECKKLVGKLTTNNDGEATTGELFFGKYYIKEISPPTLPEGGYKKSDEILEVVVTPGSDISPVLIKFPDPPVEITFDILKEDPELNEAFKAQGDATLKGGLFSVKYYDIHADDSSGLSSDPLYEWVFETDDNGVIKLEPSGKWYNESKSKDPLIKCSHNGNYIFPEGTYVMEEIKPPTGYMLFDLQREAVKPNYLNVNHVAWADEGEYKKPLFDWKLNGNFIAQSKEKLDDGIYAWIQDDKLIHGHVEIQKWDLELDKSEALNGRDHGKNTVGTHLEGITFEIYNRSDKPVIYYKNGWKPGATEADGQLIPVGGVVDQIVTYWDEGDKAYVANTKAESLGYGTYGIKEIKTTKSYLLSDGKERTFEIREDQTEVTDDILLKPLIWKNQVVRSDFKFNKIEDGSNHGLAAPWSLKSLATGETHVLVTEEDNGFTSTHSDYNLHSKNTNNNDWMLKITDGSIKTSDMDHFSGIWFSNGEDGSKAKVDDKLGAIPYGNYILKELRCENNKGKTLIEKPVTINERHGWLWELGTITNDEPTIKTTALNTANDKHDALADGKVTIVDTVSYDKLKGNKDHTMKGILMDADTGAPLLDKNNKELTAEVRFKTPKSGTGTVELTYTFDASNFKGKTVVVFEYCYNDEGGLEASHEDLNDKDQTIWFPEISTTALGKDSGLHVENAKEKTTIIDTVKYSNLFVNKTYTVKGTLMKKIPVTSGSGLNSSGSAVIYKEEPVLDSNGDKVTSTKTFVAESTSGSIGLEFTFDANLIRGETVVVFEDLYRESYKVAVHADINDAEQSVFFPEIETTAVDSISNSHTGYADNMNTIIDTVSYSGLDVGQEYILKGQLIDKNNKDNKPIDATTSPVSFIPTEADGVIGVKFTFNGYDHAEKPLVAYEELYIKVEDKEILIAEHKDIDDKQQTVKLFAPKIGTTATFENGEKEIKAGKKITIIDTVIYKNLVVGKLYTIKGILMDKETEKPIIINGKEVTSEVKFTPQKPSGAVKVEFTFDASELGGKELVVFENLYRDEMLITSHADINDTNQTVKINTSPKSSTDGGKNAKTGDPMSFIVFILIAILAAASAYVMYRTRKRIEAKKEETSTDDDNTID